MLWPSNGHRAGRGKVNGSKLPKVYIDLRFRTKHNLTFYSSLLDAPDRSTRPLPHHTRKSTFGTVPSVFQSSCALSGFSCVSDQASVPQDHPAELSDDVGFARNLWQGGPARSAATEGLAGVRLGAREALSLPSRSSSWPIQAQAYPGTTRLGSLLTSALLANFGRGPSEVGGGKGPGWRAFRRASSSSSSSCSTRCKRKRDPRPPGWVLC